MSGISGIVTNNALLPNPSKIFENLSMVQAHQGVEYVQRHYQSNSCVIVNHLTGLLSSTLIQPVCDEQQNIILFLEGEIYNLQELGDKFNHHPSLSPLQILISLYLEKGLEFVSLLEGIFNIIIFEKDRKCLTLLNDKFASEAMFFCEENGSFLFGSEKKSILAIKQTSPQLDPLGLLQVFAHEHNLQGRTFIQKIKSLSPGSYLQYCEGQVTQSCYHKFTFNVPSSLPSTRTVIHEGCQLLKDSIKAQFSGKECLLLLLSGGLDSRIIACAIPQDFYHKTKAITFGSTDSGRLDLHYGSLIANKLGLDHYISEDNFCLHSALISKIVWRTECSFSFQHARSVAIHEKLKSHGNFLINGELGGVISGSSIHPYMSEKFSRSEFINKVFKNYSASKEKLLIIFQPEFLRDQFPKLVEAFRMSFENLEADNNIRLYELWNLAERQTNFILQSKLEYSHKFEAISPVLDSKYCEFMLTFPLQWRRNQLLYQKMIYELSPKIRDIPNANNNLKLRRTIYDKIERIPGRIKGQINRATRKITQKLTNLSSVVRPSAIAGNLELYYLIENFVKSDYCDPLIFNRKRILEALENEYQGKENNQDLFYSLATFAVGIPYFIYNKTLKCPEKAG